MLQHPQGMHFLYSGLQHLHVQVGLHTINVIRATSHTTNSTITSMSSKPLRDNVSLRGSKRPAPLAKTIFIGLRALDPFLQYTILARGLATPLLSALHVSSAAAAAAPIVALGLPLKPLVVLAMAAGSSIKQIYWLAFTGAEEMPPRGAVIISIFNTVNNSLNSLFALTAAADFLVPGFVVRDVDIKGYAVSPLVLVGATTYLAGLLLEAVSETQRKAFKDDERNAGKPFTGGLFGLARHINYGGYTIWRASYALVSGGWLWGAFVGGFFGYDFANRGVPVLDQYCSKRYGVAWTEYKKKVQYKLIPGVY